MQENPTDQTTSQPNEILIGEQLEAAVRTLSVGWSVLPGKGLVRVVPTTDFNQGFEVLTRIAQLAEEKQHHPELTLRYDEVEIALTTHDVGGITMLDVAMAVALDQLLQS